MSYAVLPRRKHIKSRHGCSTCKKRRVKCDEFKPECISCHRLGLRCGYLDDADADAESSQQLSHTQEFNTTDFSLTTPLEQFPDFADRDRFFFSHLASQINDLQRQERHILALGTTLLPELLKLGTNFEHVRHSVCAFSAACLARMTMSASMIYVEYQYRDLGLQGLREALSAPSKDNLEGVLAASLLLSWGATESEEYMQTMQGVYLTMKEMDSSPHSSTLRSLMQASSDAVMPILPQPVSTVCSLDMAFASLVELQKQLGKDHQDEELIRGIKELCNYVTNMRMAAFSQASPTAQLESLFPIRSWILWMPKAFIKLSQKDPSTMLFLAHYDMVHLAMVSLLPALNTPFAISRRVDFIERLDAQLMELSMKPDGATMVSRLHDWNDLMSGPRAYAAIYRPQK